MQNYKDNQQLSDENSILTLSILSVIGDRDDQQDSFGYTLKNDEAIIVVCDGMGGHQGGSTASSLAVSSLLSDYERAYPAPLPEQNLIRSVKDADRKIASLTGADGEPLNAGSTCVALMIRDDRLYWCSVGDSRAYLLRDGEFVQLTQDQNYRTVLDERLSAGIITPAEYREEEKRGDALISYLGIGNLSLIDYSKSPLTLARGDRIIISTDGLYKLVPDEEMQRVIENFRKSAEALQALDMKAGKASKLLDRPRDNMTVALIAIK